MSSYIPQKVDLTPKRHHGYAAVLFILGTLFPPLAVAARFGIGKDFWLNLLLTVCGYIPGHGHNFYIQNIRNNKTHARTPKWAQRYGLVDTSEIKRKERKSQWANRYNDRLPNSAYEGQPVEEGQQEAGSSVDLSSQGHDSRPSPRPNGDLWNPEDEQYYNADRNASQASSGGRWHYPANFDDVEPISPAPTKKPKKKKKDKKDRWARTEDAYSISEEQSKKKKSKRKKAKDSSADLSKYSTETTEQFPEDPEGGLYGERRVGASEPDNTPKENGQTADDVFKHQF